MVVIGVFHLLFLCASIVNDGSNNLWRFLPSELTSELLLFSLVRSPSSRWHVSTIIVIGGFTHLILCASIANEGSLREMRSERREDSGAHPVLLTFSFSSPASPSILISIKALKARRGLAFGCTSPSISLGVQCSREDMPVLAPCYIGKRCA